MQTVSLSLDLLDPPVIIARQNMDPVRFQELVDDLRAHGLEQPLIVVAAAGRYRVVDGYRRWRASLQAGLLEVPCVVKELDEDGEIETLLRVGLHREDFNPVEEGMMFAVMHEGLHLTVDGIALKVGKSISYVTARLAIVHGPEDVREALREGQISLSVARELLRLHHDGDRDYVLSYAKGGGATADTVRRWVNERLLARVTLPATAPVPEGAPAPPAPTVIMGTCEWHRGQVPIDGTLSFRVCGQCYTALAGLRQHLEEQDKPSEEVRPDVAPG